MIGIFYKELIKISKKYLILAVIIGAVTSSPLIHYSLTNDQAFARAKGVSIFSANTQLKLDEQQKWTDDNSSGNIFGRIFHNKFVNSSREVAEGYLLHYDLNWLFIKGDLSRHHAPGMSILYLWDLPFLLSGIYLLIFSKIPQKAKLFIFSWYLIAPIPASVSSGLPHAVRTLNFLPTFQIFTAIGFLSFIFFLIKIRQRFLIYPIKLTIIIFIFLLFIFNFIYYLNQYFIQQNYFYSSEWQYGYKEAVAYVAQNHSQYDQIVVSNQSPLDQSYMFFLFYLKYPPVVYQNEDLSRTGGFRETHKFDKYEFRPIVWENEKNKAKTLYIGGKEDFNKGGTLLKKINYLNGEPAIFIYKE